MISSTYVSLFPALTQPTANVTDRYIFSDVLRLALERTLTTHILLASLHNYDSDKVHDWSRQLPLCRRASLHGVSDAQAAIYHGSTPIPGPIHDLWEQSCLLL